MNFQIASCLALTMVLLQGCGDIGLIQSGTAGASGGDTSATTAGNASGTSVGTASTNNGQGGSSTSTGTPSSTGTSSGTTSRSIRESWVWVYTNWTTSLNTIASNQNAFTHISPTLYTLNYNYTGGVAYYTTCPYSSGLNCSANGSNNFDGMTTAQMAAKINALGMQTVPAIYAGAANNGSDQGVQNILNNTNNAGTNFITAMVNEAVANGYAGYNLDWEMGSGVGSSYAASFVTFANDFKAALAAHNMSLSVDAIVSNINGTWCSGNNGYLDFGMLGKSTVDRVIIEDYTGSLGTASTSCQNVTLSSTSPASCPVNSSNTDVTATGLYNFMCSNLPMERVVIGFESYSSATNPIAGSAFAALESYGFDKVAVWPQVESSYPFLSANKLSAPQANWYALLAEFLVH